MILPIPWFLSLWGPFFLWSSSLCSLVICFHNHYLNYVPSLFSISSIMLSGPPPAIFPTHSFQYPLSNLYLTPSGLAIYQWYQYFTFSDPSWICSPSYPGWILWLIVIIPHLHISMTSLPRLASSQAKIQPKLNPTLSLLHACNCATEHD